jgi:hypothetical protein
MIDHLMTFADEARARTDAVVGQYFSNGAWRSDCCIANVFVWVPADETTVSASDGNGNTITTTVRQPYDANWRLVIARPQPDAALTAHPACHLVTDRDAAMAGQTFVIQSVLSEVELAALALEPVFAGASYPFGTPA